MKKVFLFVLLLPLFASAQYTPNPTKTSFPDLKAINSFQIPTVSSSTINGMPSGGRYVFYNTALSSFMVWDGSAFRVVPVLTSAGNLLVGSTSDSSKVVAKGAANNLGGFRVESTTGAQSRLSIFGNGSGSGTIQIMQPTGSLNITNSAGTNLMQINTSTNGIGIGGITSPTAALDLPASTTALAPLRVRAGATPTAHLEGEFYKSGNIYRGYSTVSRRFVTVNDAIINSGSLPIGSSTDGEYTNARPTGSNGVSMTYGSGTLDISLGDITPTSANIAGFFSTQANYGVTALPSAFYNTALAKFGVVNNLSNGDNEVNFLSTKTNVGGASVGGFAWHIVSSAGVRVQVAKIAGSDYAFTTAGRIAPGIIDASSSTTNLFAQYDATTRALVSRTKAQVKSDLGVPISGNYSGVGTATTTFTVTIGTTMANNIYPVQVTPTSSLSAAMFYVTNKTTTTFDVVYLAGLTGTVTFDWSVFP